MQYLIDAAGSVVRRKRHGPCAGARSTGETQRRFRNKVEKRSVAPTVRLRMPVSGWVNVRNRQGVSLYNGVNLSSLSGCNTSQRPRRTCPVWVWEVHGSKPSGTVARLGAGESRDDITKFNNSCMGNITERSEIESSIMHSVCVGLACRRGWRCDIQPCPSEVQAASDWINAQLARLPCPLVG